MLKKIKRVFFAIAICFFCAESNGAIHDKGKFDFVASFDDIAITKFDLDNLLQISQYKERKKDKSEKKYKETLDEYINLLIQEKIIKNTASVKELTEKEKIDTWSLFSGNFNTTQPLEKFCDEKNIEVKFFKRYLYIQHLWKKFVDVEIIGKMRVDDFYVEQFLEFNSKQDAADANYYSLSEIVIYYNNQEEKNRVEAILGEVNRKNFDKYLSKYSQSMSKNGYLGWFLIGDLSENVAEKIKKTGVGEVTDITCLEKSVESGSCFVFRINEIRSSEMLSDNDKKNIKTHIRNIKVEEKIKDLVEKTRKNSKIRLI
jgi:hypothetical protein